VGRRCPEPDGGRVRDDGRPARAGPPRRDKTLEIDSVR
jgi:hypothetical protein